jgi:hypothetical protein
LSTSSRRSSAASSNRTRAILRNRGSTEPYTKTQVVVPEVTPDGCGSRPDDRFRNLQRLLTLTARTAVHAPQRSLY